MNKYEQTRLAAEADFETYIRLVQPNRMLGSVHSELCTWLTRKDRKSHCLVLLPRDHQKSAIVGALYTTWRITRNPAIRILYVSSTSNLATKQLKAIKDILTSDLYRLFWPEMVNKEEAKRDKWSETEIAVDHPIRKEQYIRDPTVFSAGLTTSVTGMHADLIIMDDVVVYENAYTDEGRQKVALQYSYLASVEGTYGEQVVVGTRYHPDDLYNTILNKRIPIRNEKKEVIKEEPLYDIFERQVENLGDGTGEFLWPRQRAPNGQEFGFNIEILDNKKSLYAGNEVEFYAQYYNNPNMAGDDCISRSTFQYYDKSWLRQVGGIWYYKDQRLNITAAVDFAYTVSKRSDYTSIVVIGIDANNKTYILDIDRFKTGDPSVYYEHILKMHNKWGFWQLIAEATGAQQYMVNDLKINYIRPNGLGLTIKEVKPHRYLGAKEERIHTALKPRYDNGQMFHYLGGNCQILEDELVLRKPPHDDVKDALTLAVLNITAPIQSTMHNYNHYNLQETTHRRFGGVA